MSRVFGYVEDERDLWRCRLVSRAWKALVEKQPCAPSKHPHEKEFVLLRDKVQRVNAIQKQRRAEQEKQEKEKGKEVDRGAEEEGPRLVRLTFSSLTENGSASSSASSSSSYAASFASSYLFSANSLLRVPPKKDYVSQLPSEVLIFVLQKLDARSLCRISMVSFVFWTVANQNESQLWKSLYESRWPASRWRSVSPQQYSNFSYKLLYILNDISLRLRSFAPNQEKKYIQQVAALYRPDTASSASSSSSSSASNAPKVILPSRRRADSSTAGASSARGRVTPSDVASANVLRRMSEVSSPDTSLPSRNCVACALFIGPKGIGKSSLLSTFAFGKFESNPKLDFDRFEAIATKEITLGKTKLSLRMHTLTRIPDYNDLFNVAAVVICYDMSKPFDKKVVESWMSKVEDRASANTMVVALGLCSDLSTTSSSAAPPLLGGRPSFCVSAKTGGPAKLEPFFRYLAANVLERPELWVAPTVLEK
ncbi:F-box domain-containing protein [Balamuthia mandrillaris]